MLLTERCEEAQSILLVGREALAMGVSQASGMPADGWPAGQDVSESGSSGPTTLVPGRTRSTGRGLSIVRRLRRLGRLYRMMVAIVEETHRPSA